MLLATNQNFIICEETSLPPTLWRSVRNRFFLMLALLMFAGVSAFAQASISVSVSANTGGLTVGQTFSSLIATVSNDSQNRGVTWSATGGSFSLTSTASGAATAYTAPATAGVYTVTATSVTDITRSASITLGVTDLASVFTYHNNNSRDGVNQQEFTLTTSNVNTSTFGKLFSCPVDGAVYAQPLWVANVSVGGNKRNLVVVATAHDSIYAFDADARPCVKLWQTSLLGSGEVPVPSGTTGNLVGGGSGDITPETGVIGTPVIDTSTNTVYVVSKSVITSGPTFFQRLHALDLATGTEKTSMSSPSTISFSGFNAQTELQRAGLGLANGVVYICWASHEDMQPYHGLVAGYSASNVSSLVARFNDTPNGSMGGIWMSGGAPAIDSSNNLYVISGNGTFDTSGDYGDSFIKLSPTGNPMTVVDSFTPYNQADLTATDKDLGAGGAAILVDLPQGAPHRQLIVGGGKGITFGGELYVLDRTSLGGYQQGSGATDKVVQEFSFNHAIFATGAFWQNTLFIAGVSGPLQAFALNPSTSQFATNPVATSSFPTSFGFPGATASISTNGTIANTTVIWALNSSQYCTNQSKGCGPAILYAYDPNLHELWDSTMASGDAAGNAVKFTLPTVANGKVYVGSRGNNTGGAFGSTSVSGQLDVYGLLNTAVFAATPVISPASQSFNTSIQVTITDATPGASIYYTTDGSNPTTGSLKYATPFTLTATTTVKAIAAGTGLLQSAVASATYTSQAGQAATPTFSPAAGFYTTAQSVVISTTTPSATIYYTIDGTTPTTSSSKYTAAVSVGATETLSAIAVASGLTNSSVASGLYTINPGGIPINFGNGFTAGSMALLGSAKLNGTALRLTDGGTFAASAAWYNVPVNIQNFTTDFTFLITPGTSPIADGLTFTIQGNSVSSIGSNGGGLGYGSDTPTGALGIPKSVAIKFDFSSNIGEGVDSTGLYINGASPTTPYVDMSGSGIDLRASHPIHAHITFDGSNLVMLLTDTTTNGTFTHTWPINIASTVGANTAYVGFTGGSGFYTAIQDIQTWTFAAAGTGTPTPAATPAFSLAGGTYLGTQTVSLSDSTAGAAIYYTTNNTTPTTSSTKYSSAITVAATQTIQAIATATGFSQSAVASATYTIQSQVPVPTFSPGGGTYTAAQTVTISDTAAGATIYYTTNGTAPTTSSTQYTAPINVSVSQTINAIAVVSGFFNSNVATAAYTISPSGGTAINFSTGFTAGSMALLGSAKLNGTALRLTDGGTFAASAAWYNVPVNIQNFTTDFTFLITPGTSPIADGLTFTIQGNSVSSIGSNGGGLGYGSDTPTGALGIPKSVAIKFDFSSNIGEGVDSTGLYINGASPTTPYVDMSGSGIDLRASHPIHAHITFDGSNLVMLLTDTTTNGTFTHTWPINIASTVGANTAYVGFTGGSGFYTAIQDIQTWTFAAAGTGTPTPAATPAFSLAGGTYLGTQTVSLSDSTAGAAIYYTTNNTTPTTSSTKYSSAITVAATQTIQAIATATGFSQSAVASATYTIQSQVPVPTFSPGGGTYTAAQTVTISDTAAGATIYYTTNGTAPTTSSTQYTAPINVSVSQTINAIAVVSGFFNSNVATAAYTISPSGGTAINFSTGFTAGSMILNGGAALNGTRLRLTDTGANEARSAWYNAPVNIQQFTTSFNFQVTGGTSPTADGFTFTIQGGPSTALGPSGGGLGYGPDNVTNPSASSNTPIAKSVAVKFDLSSNAGEGANSTGLYINGVSPTTPFVDMTSSGVNLHTADILNVQMTYDGTNLTMLITDTTTNAFFTNSWPINISSTVGGTTAYVGFTGGTGTNTATQEIIGWTMTSAAVAAATPVISPATGTYSSSQTVNITDSTSGATIYYTTDGSQPTTSSTKYTAAFPVSVTTTVKAIAAAPGFVTSATASSVITISGTKTPVVYRTETLPAASSGPTFRQFTYEGFPDTTGTILDATKAGDNVTFTVNVATSGIYDVKLSYKKLSTRGISQLTINGTNVGPLLDQYAANDSYATADFGTFNFAAAGNYSFKFTVTGKNAASIGYPISFDNITLTPQ